MSRELNPKISVIMTVYNGEKFLDESIQSILGQSFRDFEFIIINDCSTDNTPKIISKYKKEDSRIIIVENKENLKLTRSLNIGLGFTRGKYIARIDSDDISLPERLEIQYDSLERNPGFFLVGGGAIDIDKDGNEIRVHKPITDELKLKERLSIGNAIYHSTIMFRNEKSNYYREKFVYSQDYDFYLMMLSKGKRLVNIPDVLIKYRISPNAISWDESVKQGLFALKAKEFYHQRVKYGEDLYDKFDPNEILDLDVERVTDKAVLCLVIGSSFRVNNFKKAREVCRKYFRYHGYLSKVLIYYLTSFLGKRIVNSIRKGRSIIFFGKW